MLLQSKQIDDNRLGKAKAETQAIFDLYYCTFEISSNESPPAYSCNDVTKFVTFLSLWTYKFLTKEFLWNFRTYFTPKNKQTQLCGVTIIG